ncbi:hypothetical protein Tco_1359493 [Tanacetum coccineum]
MSGPQDEISPPPPPPSTSQTPSQPTPHTVSTIKLPILKKGEYDIWVMKMEHYLAHTDYPIWEIDENDIEGKYTGEVAQEEPIGFDKTKVNAIITTKQGIILLEGGVETEGSQDNREVDAWNSETRGDMQNRKKVSE